MFGFNGCFFEYRFEVGEQRNSEWNEVFDSRIRLIEAIDASIHFIHLAVKIGDMGLVIRIADDSLKPF